MGQLLDSAETERHIAWVLESWYALRDVSTRSSGPGRSASYDECGQVEIRLGVEPGLLSSCAAYTRTRAGIRDPELVSPPTDTITADAVAAMVGRLSAGGGTTSDWLLIAALGVQRHPGVIGSLSDLAEPLMLSMIRSCQRVYRQITLSGTLLAGIPEAQDPLLAQAQALLTDPYSQNHRQPLMLLEHIPTPTAAALVLDVVETVTNPFVSAQARRVLTSQVARGLLNESDRSRLGVMVLARWRADPVRARAELGDLVAVMPEGFRIALARSGPTPPASSSETDTSEVVDLLSAHTPDSDPGLEELMGMAIGDPAGERRHLASVFLASSGYREVVAEVCMQMLENNSRACPMRARAGELLRYVCTDGQRLRLQRLLVDPDPEVATFAAQSCGQLRPSRLLDQAIRSHLTMKHDVVNRSLLYALGMHGSEALPLLVEAPATPDWLRGGARWWIRVGPGLR